MQRFYQLAQVTRFFYQKVTLPYKVLYRPFSGASPNRPLYQLKYIIQYASILDYTSSGCLRAYDMGPWYCHCSYLIVGLLQRVD